MAEYETIMLSDRTKPCDIALEFVRLCPLFRSEKLNLFNKPSKNILIQVPTYKKNTLDVSALLAMAFSKQNLQSKLRFHIVFTGDYFHQKSGFEKLGLDETTFKLYLYSENIAYSRQTIY